MALFRHGLLEHGLESLWHAPPVLYWLHSQMYCCNELRRQKPWFEQFIKHADKSPVYEARTSFNCLPALFGLNIDETFKEDWVVFVFLKNDDTGVVVTLNCALKKY